MKISLGIILFTGCEKYLPFSLKSLIAQDYPDLEILLRDQSPAGEVKAWIEKNMPEVIANPKIRLIAGPNLMHSGGHNLLIRQMTGDSYIVASNDMYYPPDFVSKAAAELNKPENQTIGTLSPKLLRWDFAKAGADLNTSLTNQIDSCGIGLKPTHHFYDVGQGEKDEGQYDQKTALFGASGALTIIRKSALEQIKYENEYYDELLHYKNDCDLAYRLQWAGVPCRFMPQLKVWHDRQVSGDKGVLKSREDKSDFAKASSLFGHLVTLEKNFDQRFSYKILFLTALYNLAKGVYIALREPALKSQYQKFKEALPLIRAKRKAMKIVALPSSIESLMS